MHVMKTSIRAVLEQEWECPTSFACSEAGVMLQLLRHNIGQFLHCRDWYSDTAMLKVYPGSLVNHRRYITPSDDVITLQTLQK